ncbi:unnamed protein product, partial [Durusdinium trenchii]
HYTRTLPDPVVEEVRVVHHPPPVVQHYRVVHHFSDMWYRLRGHPCRAVLPSTCCRPEVRVRLFCG